MTSAPYHKVKCCEPEMVRSQKLLLDVQIFHYLIEEL